MAAHQVGVAAAVTYLDGQVGTRTGRDGAKHVAGSGLVAVGFTHRVSRSGDPLPHTHLVIVNRTQGPDGGWRTGGGSSGGGVSGGGLSEGDRPGAGRPGGG